MRLAASPTSQTFDSRAVGMPYHSWSFLAIYSPQHDDYPCLRMTTIALLAFTGVSILYFEPIFSACIYLATLPALDLFPARRYKLLFQDSTLVLTRMIPRNLVILGVMTLSTQQSGVSRPRIVGFGG